LCSKKQQNRTTSEEILLENKILDRTRLSLAKIGFFIAQIEE